MQSANLADLRAYTSLISAYASIKDVASAQQAFDDMLHASFSPSIVSYGALLKAHVNAKDVVGCRELFVAMQRDRGIPPDDAMKRMFGKLVGREKAEEIFAEFSKVPGELGLSKQAMRQ